MRHILGSGRMSGGWGGLGVEEDWVKFVSKAALRKLERLTAPGFRRCSRNWLAIYSNTPCQPDHFDYALARVNEAVASLWRRSPRFDSIFILHGTYIVCLFDGGATLLEPNDLWRPAAAGPVVSVRASKRRGGTAV